MSVDSWPTMETVATGAVERTRSWTQADFPDRAASIVASPLFALVAVPVASTTSIEESELDHATPVAGTTVPSV
jgi:hypothetical protein